MMTPNAEFKILPPEHGQRMPLVISPTSNRNLDEVIGAHLSEFQERLLAHGALLFRGFDIADLDGFDRAIAAIRLSRMNYTYRSTPRTELEKHIYTATEYPPSEEIALHNENAYQRRWPLKMALCCLMAAERGGETPIADRRRVSTAIGASLMQVFEQRRVLYVRHYRPYVDIQWQAAFQTTDWRDVAQVCASAGIEHEWLTRDVLRTKQIAQGTAAHPETGEVVFFNQAHLFHVSSLGAGAAQVLRELYGQELPRQAYFGDGAEIDPRDLSRIRSAFDEQSILFKWQKGDVLLLDNMQVAHGRRSYVGQRKVLISLMEQSKG